MVPRVTDPRFTVKRIGCWSIAAGAAAACCLYRFPPETYPFYPPCPIHQWTGLLCPGCGATRALAALLHGDLHHALMLNPLIVILLPLLAIYLARSWSDRRWYPVSSAVGTLLFAGILLCTLSRNLHSR